MTLYKLILAMLSVPAGLLAGCRLLQGLGLMKEFTDYE